MNDFEAKLKKMATGIFSGTPVLFAYFYGSRAVGLGHPFSDLDIGIFVEEIPPDTGLKLELSIALEIDKELGHVLESDVRIINDLPLTVKGKIVTEGILIYSRQEERRVEFETWVRNAYFDFLPVIAAYQLTYREMERARS
jgi:predicted nucleotidyltransferase